MDISKNRQVITQRIIDYLMIAAGTFLLGYAVIAFWYPHNMVTGGLSGLAIIIAYYSINAGWEIPIWLTTAVVNVPLFLLGFRILGRTYFIRSVFSAVFLTFSLFLAEFLPAPDTDLFLSAVFGGVFAGVGVGIVLRTMAATGGSTLAAAIIKEKFFPHVSVARVLFFVDTSIILVGLLVFGPVYTMYAVVAIFVSTKVTDTVLEGLSFAKAAFIISKENTSIAEAILKDMNRGVTEISSRGMFTKKAQPMLMCVVSAKELVTLKQLVHSVDESAFVIVTDVREVMGEGFTKKKEEIKKEP